MFGVYVPFEVAYLLRSRPPKLWPRACRCWLRSSTSLGPFFFARSRRLSNRWRTPCASCSATFRRVTSCYLQTDRVSGGRGKRMTETKRKSFIKQWWTGGWGGGVRKITGAQGKLHSYTHIIVKLPCSFRMLFLCIHPPIVRDTPVEYCH